MTRRQIGGLLALSLWSSLGWLLDDLFPGQTLPIAARGFRLLLLGGFSLAVRLLQGPVTFDRRLVTAAVTSLGLVGLPFLLLSGAQGRIASTDSVLLFALIPVAVALFGGGNDGVADRLGLVPYGLVGVTGILILLPVRMPEGASGVLGLFMLAVAAALMSGCLIWLKGTLQRLSLAGAAATICLANGALLSVAAFFIGTGGWSFQSMEMEGVRCLLIDLPETVLMLWLLRSISPWQLSTRYILVPLFTVLEGLWLVRPTPDLRTGGGIILLATAAVLMIAREPTENRTTLRLT